jgi:hypothetical protein
MIRAAGRKMIHVVGRKMIHVAGRKMIHAVVIFAVYGQIQYMYDSGRRWACQYLVR